MLTLCLDTAYKYLSVSLIEDDQILAAYDEICPKRQSEEIFQVLNRILQEGHKEILSIDSLCISCGPGSYTGVRIAMTLAKTIASLRELDLYTISTLRLYAANEKDTMVLMDARAKRAYVAVYDEAECLLSDCVLPLEEIDPADHRLVGDASLFGKEDRMPKISEAFLRTRAYWQKVDNVDHLVPVYLKEDKDCVK
ncbi:MAG: tRNA (adenosine(37)-N6)-threonylcarbamoyltransferase complex dimerization subunit type 1 TsaB [Erysipelotrichaceae bacterium]|nr:tRNA (adenosine(37)-N6)-threonylcarbamoyltransferase complex dimerization subunit type 1 TsaB [Erysipelotrichaceae bacterium]